LLYVCVVYKTEKKKKMEGTCPTLYKSLIYHRERDPWEEEERYCPCCSVPSSSEEEEEAPLLSIPHLSSSQKKMATKCCGQRRLSELLQEQQEPFLVRRPVPVLVARSMLCGAKAVRKALLWDLAAGCFSACSDGGRQLRLRSEEEESTTELSHCKRPASFPASLHSPALLY
jgi:hypothetical protein